MEWRGIRNHVSFQIHGPFLENVYVERPDGRLCFRRVEHPRDTEIDQPTQLLAQPIGRRTGTCTRFPDIFTCKLELLVPPIALSGG